MYVHQQSQLLSSSYQLEESFTIFLGLELGSLPLFCNFMPLFDFQLGKNSFDRDSEEMVVFTMS